MASPGYFNKFFDPDEDMQDYIHLLNIGTLSLPSGRLIAADPLVGLSRDTPPFTRTIPAGEYEVVLCILSEDPRKSYGEYAATRVCFTNRPAMRFEQALTGTEDPEEVQAGESFGFPVDTGLACFCDPRVCAALCDFEEQMQQEKPDSDLYNDLWCDLLEENARRYPDYQSDSGNWLNFQIPGTDYHLPLFRSGYGDGCYSTYWGLDEEGRICQAVIEFIGLEDEYRTILRKQARKTFQPDGQQINGKERMASRMAALRGIVQQHPEGHLPLANRVELYRHIGNPVVVQRILCECCKKVYPLWEQYVCKEQSFLRLLRAANDFLYRPQGDPGERRATQEKLVSQARQLSNYATYYGENARSITAYAIVKLCYSILAGPKMSCCGKTKNTRGKMTPTATTSTRMHCPPILSPNWPMSGSPEQQAPQPLPCAGNTGFGSSTWLKPFTTIRNRNTSPCRSLPPNPVKRTSPAGKATWTGVIRCVPSPK